MAQEQATEALAKLCVGTAVTNPDMINDFLKKATEKCDQQRNLILGKVKEGDKILSKETEQVDAVFLGSAEHSFKYFGSKGVVITCVAMLDKWTDGLGGDATLTHGGVGHNHVVFNVVSRFSRDSSFTMVVWGTEQCL